MNAIRKGRALGAVALVALLMVGAASAEKSVLRLWLKGPVGESPSPDAQLAALFGAEAPTTLYSLTQTLKDAAKDEDVRGIVLVVDNPLLGFAQISELRRSMMEFRDSGKRIHAYLDAAGNAGYLVATAADTITIAEYGMLDTAGIGAVQTYYKNFMEKFGMYAQMHAISDYKSAVEPFTRSEPSRAAREQTNWLLDSLFEQYVGMISEGRKLDSDKVKALIDQAPLMANEALEGGLVDAVSGWNTFREGIKAEYGSEVEVLKSLDDADGGLDVDLGNPFAFFQMFQDAMDKATEEPKDAIAVIYAEGPIVVAENESSPFGGGTTAGSTSIRATLLDAAEDDSIKAVVFRVNSPGGSALASDIMYRAAQRVAANKPFIVSMGNVAASGGYYIAAPGERIFAEPNTVTGSIGILGGKIVWDEFWEEELGMTSTLFSRGKQALMLNPNRAFTDGERQWLRSFLEKGYAQFLGRVTDSRGDRLKEDLEDIAGGRVFTGKQALELGLVDELGGLNDAIAYAAKRAGMDEPVVRVLPEPKDFAAILAEAFGEGGRDAWEVHAGPVGTVRMGSPFSAATLGAVTGNDPFQMLVSHLAARLDATQLKSLESMLFQMELIHRENAAMFLPLDVVLP